MFELYEELLPTCFNICKYKTHTSFKGEVWCRLCGKAPESIAHILSGCSLLAHSKYISWHNSALKILFYEMLHDVGLIEEFHPSDTLKPSQDSDDVQAYWDVLGFADHVEVCWSRVDAWIINHKTKPVITVKMSWLKINNREKKSKEKTVKYAPPPPFLHWELNSSSLVMKWDNTSSLIPVGGGHGKCTRL